ncbi:hypothetical protein KAFR_0E03360 [Kazachstania africana CBS 2517]|uniref:Peptide hydrolase n=1 Tax=Kazachstania africana (strain ATCC 22294 / BCRC 22015 / CBS 2517 / CECT 1963 / NBRC 1671 / NRRL Y-8276) TaxID=1071382 RepID=H2AVT8_KAZAF|nr:hypothetical protein KAFR_0E03360 [Kazachstania africana CBS 2517]CCF58488.1 hypothetical protein KAFR_0E03360 [Kazachstania africana CBS 2517]
MKVLPVLLAVCSIASSAGAFPFQPLRYLEVADGEIIAVTEDKKLSLLRGGIKFFDVTKHYKRGYSFFEEQEETPIIPEFEYPTNVTHSDVLEPLFKKIDQSWMHDKLAHFTNFYTRYYKSETGYEAALWLSEQIEALIEGLPDGFVSIKHFDHNEWKQFSIIVRFEGSLSPENVVVIGSHLDSINLLLPSILPAPGADDNGSGTTSNLEALRIFVEYLKSTETPLKNSVEFHFYSAEEGGLLGSLDVFTEYAKSEKRVVAMLQQDMTGYVHDPQNEHVGVIVDYTTPTLTDFTKLVVDEYLSIPYVETTCGYACSDHGSATKNGFPAAFVIESTFRETSKFIHSTMDTIDRLSFSHMAEHVKLVLGTVFELGEWDHFVKK